MIELMDHQKEAIRHRLECGKEYRDHPRVKRYDAMDGQELYLVRDCYGNLLKLIETLGDDNDLGYYMCYSNILKLYLSRVYQ